ncbi:MAG: cupin domain-containing protein [Chloroflexota bacterium]|nr:MAG: cupin domain-containing protein [Chloroflexota bacterium]
MPLPPENLIDVAAALRGAQASGPIWSVNSEQLNVNLVRLASGEEIAEHVNAELDVLLVALEGAGELRVDGEVVQLGAGIAALIPAGSARGLRCTRGPLVYITCHRRRPGLMPTFPAQR